MKVLVRETISDAGVELLRSRFDVDVDADSDARGDHRRLRRDRRPLGDEAHRRPDRPRRPPQGDRPRRRRRRQRRRRGGDAARDRRRERAGVDGRLRRRAHDRAARRARAQHPAGARGAQAGPLGAQGVRRHRARRQDARRARLRPHRPAGRAPRARARDARRRVRPVRRGRPVPRARRRARRDAGGGLRSRRLPHAAPAARRRRRAARSTPPRSRAMRDGVRIVNAARGELVDEDALLDALRSGKVAGAALDVFSTEPYSGPLLELDNVVVTPHLAASTDEAQDRAGVIVAEQVVAALEGGLVTNAVNIPVDRRRGPRGARPVRPARREARPPRDGARRRRRPTRSSSPRTAASPTTTRASSTVAALNGAFQGRADRPVNYVNAPLIARRARDRGARGALAVGARLHEPPPRRGRAVGDEQIRVAGTTIGSDDRLWLVNVLGFELELELAPLLRPLPLRRRARRDRPRRHAVRRGRRQHREHDRLAQPPRRQGADGALGRLCAAARARRAAPRRRLRRRARPRPRACRSRPWTAWPEPVERVAAVLRAAGIDARVEEFPRGDADRASRPRARSAASRSRSSSRSSSSATAGRCSRSFPATGAPTPTKVAAAAERGLRARRAAGGGPRGDGLRAGRRRAVPGVRA